MPLGEEPADRRDEVPPADKRLLVAAGVLLLIPIVALMWVGSYNQEEPKLWGFPFFFWYQFLWVFLCSAMTWTAFKLVTAARRRPDPSTGPSTSSGSEFGSGNDLGPGNDFGPGSGGR